MVSAHKNIFTICTFVIVLLFVGLTLCTDDGDPQNISSEIETLVAQKMMTMMATLAKQFMLNIPRKVNYTTVINNLNRSINDFGPHDGDKVINFNTDQIVKTVAKQIKNRINVTNGKNRREKSEIKLIPKPRKAEFEIKQKLLKTISDKMYILAEKYAQNAKTVQDKKKVLRKVRRMIMNSARRLNPQKLKAYSDVVALGLEITRNKIMDPQKQWLAKNYSDVVNHRKAANKDINLNPALIVDIQEIDKYEKLISNALKATAADAQCDDIIDETCSHIQKIAKLTCADGNTISLEKICDGVMDCDYGSDEQNCTTIVIDKAQRTYKTMAEIDDFLSRKCVNTTNIDTNTELLIVQNNILREVLDTHLKGLKEIMVTETNLHSENVNSTNYQQELLSSSIFGVIRVINSLTQAMEASFCASRMDPNSTTVMKYNEVDFGVDILENKEVKWSPALCTCQQQFCKDECHVLCKRTCWQKHSLSHWGCAAVNGGTSISLDELCDGKVDCYDESDEKNCVTGDRLSKFEAVSMYNFVLELVGKKMLSSEYVSSRNKLLALTVSIRELQKLATKQEADLGKVRKFRDDAFMTIEGIYDDLMKIYTFDILDEEYMSLYQWNENLVKALKLSHIGHNNMIPPDSCVCRNGACALRNCPEPCIRTCKVEPILSRFSCNIGNLTLPIDEICNGKENCPNGEDEKYCGQDVCRAHHLVVLRQKLKTVEKKYKDTVLGYAIEIWMTKATATLVAAEGYERPNHKMIGDIMTRLSADLVKSYLSLNDVMKSIPESALDAFRAISKIIQDTLKSCVN